MKTTELKSTKQRAGAVEFEPDPLQKEKVYQRFCKKVLNNEFGIEFKVTQGRGPKSFSDLDNTRDIYEDCKKEPDLYIDSDEHAIALEVKLDPNDPGGLGKALWYREMGFRSGIVTTEIPEEWFINSCFRAEVPITIIETDPSYTSGLQDYRVLHFDDLKQNSTFNPEDVYREVTSMQYINYYKRKAEEWKDEAQKKQIIKEDIHKIDELLCDTVDILDSSNDITRTNLPVILHLLAYDLTESQDIEDINDETGGTYDLAQEKLGEAAENLKKLHSILYDYGLSYGELTFDDDTDSINRQIREK